MKITNEQLVNLIKEYLLNEEQITLNLDKVSDETSALMPTESEIEQLISFADKKMSDDNTREQLYNFLKDSNLLQENFLYRGKELLDAFYSGTQREIDQEVQLTYLDLFYDLFEIKNTGLQRDDMHAAFKYIMARYAINVATPFAIGSVLLFRGMGPALILCVIMHFAKSFNYDLYESLSSLDRAYTAVLTLGASEHFIKNYSERMTRNADLICFHLLNLYMNTQETTSSSMLSDTTEYKIHKLVNENSFLIIADGKKYHFDQSPQGKADSKNYLKDQIFFEAFNDATAAMVQVFTDINTHRSDTEKVHKSETENVKIGGSGVRSKMHVLDNL